MSTAFGGATPSPVYRRVQVVGVNEEGTEVQVAASDGFRTSLDGTVRPKGTTLPAKGEVWIIERLDATTWMLRAMVAAADVDLGAEVNAIVAAQLQEKLAEEAAITAERAAKEAALAAGIMEGTAVVLIQSAAPGAEHQNTSTLWIDTTNDQNRPMRWSGEQWIVVVDKTAMEAARVAVAAKNASDSAAALAQSAKETADAAKESADKAVLDAENALAAAAGKGRVIYGIPESTPGEPNSLLIGPGNVLYHWDGVAWVEATPQMMLDLQDELDALVLQVDQNITDLATVQEGLVGVQGAVDGKSTIYPVGSSPTLGPEDVGDMRLLVDGGVEYWDGTQWKTADPRVAAAVNEAAEALGLANTKSTTYYKATPPTVADIEAPETAFSINDLWLRTEDNRLHRWNGNAWVEVKDAAITAAEGAIVDLQEDLVGVSGRIDGKSTIYVQETAPTDVSGLEDKGDIWIDIAGGGRVYKVWDGDSWEIADDPRVGEALADLDRKITTYYATEANKPVGSVAAPLVRGDLWLRSPDNRLHRWDGVAWVDAGDERIYQSEQAIATIQGDLVGINGKIDAKAIVYYQAADPSTGASPAWGSDQTGDIWIDITDANAPLYKVWTGAAWKRITDPVATQALSTVRTKVTTYYKATQPVVSDIAPPETAFRTGDLWIRTSDNVLHRYDGTTFVETSDARIGQQATAIANILGASVGLVSLNLATDPTTGGAVSAWSTTGVGHTLTVENTEFQGRIIKAVKSRSSNSGQVYTDDIPVKPGATYEVRFWVRDTLPRSTISMYFGMRARSASGSVVNVSQVTRSNGTVSETSNPYFITGVTQNSHPPGVWHEVVAYIYPEGTTTAAAREGGKGNVSNVVILPGAATISPRVLNWGLDGTNANDLWIGEMSIREVGGPTAAQAAATAQRTADGKNTVYYSTSPASGAARTGDIWRQVTSDTYRTVIAEWRCNSSGVWTAVDYGDEVLRSLDVGKLTTGFLNAEVTVSGVLRTAETGARSELSSAGLLIYDDAENVILDATGGSVVMKGALQTGTDFDSGIHITPDGSVLGQGIIQFKSGNPFASMHAAIALEAKSGNIAQLTLRGAPFTSDGISRQAALDIGTSFNSTAIAAYAERITLDAGSEGSITLQGRTYSDSLTLANHEIGGAWETYIPNLRMGTTIYGWGNSTALGKWKKVGRTVFLNITVVMGSTFVPGPNGYWELSLPHAAPSSPTSRTQIILGHITADTEYAMTAKIESSDPGWIKRSYHSHSAIALRGSRPTGSAYPWQAGDRIYWSGSYEAAS